MARSRGTPYADWLRARSARLLRPALWFVAFGTVLPVTAVAVGLLPSGIARVGGEEVALPLWFLAVYVLAIPAIPPLLAVHRRFGVWTLVSLGVAAGVVDALRFGADVPVIGVAVPMIGLTHGVRSNTLPPSGALLALAVWQCGAMLLLEDSANRWRSRTRPWPGVVIANGMVMTFFLWNMSAGVVAGAVLLGVDPIAPLRTVP